MHKWTTSILHPGGCWGTIDSDQMTGIQSGSGVLLASSTPVFFFVAQRHDPVSCDTGSSISSIEKRVMGLEPTTFTLAT